MPPLPPGSPTISLPPPGGEHPFVQPFAGVAERCVEALRPSPVPKPSSEMEKYWTRASDMAGAPQPSSCASSSIDSTAARACETGQPFFAASAASWKAASSMPGCRDAGAQLDALDREAVVDLVEVDGRVGLDALHVVAGLAQLAGEGHREAAGVRRRDQLLGVRAVALLEARLERVRALVGAAAHPHRPVALGQRAVPYGACGPLRHREPPDRCVCGRSIAQNASPWTTR